MNNNSNTYNSYFSINEYTSNPYIDYQSAILSSKNIQSNNSSNINLSSIPTFNSGKKPMVKQNSLLIKTSIDVELTPSIISNLFLISINDILNLERLDNCVYQIDLSNEKSTYSIIHKDFTYYSNIYIKVYENYQVQSLFLSGLKKHYNIDQVKQAIKLNIPSEYIKDIRIIKDNSQVSGCKIKGYGFIDFKNFYYSLIYHHILRSNPFLFGFLVQIDWADYISSDDYSKNCLFLSGFDESINEIMIFNIFKEYYEIVSIRFPNNNENSHNELIINKNNSEGNALNINKKLNKGFCFIEFKNEADAAKALKEFKPEVYFNVKCEFEYAKNLKSLKMHHQRMKEYNNVLSKRSSVPSVQTQINNSLSILSNEKMLNIKRNINDITNNTNKETNSMNSIKKLVRLLNSHEDYIKSDDLLNKKIEDIIDSIEKNIENRNLIIK